MGINSYSLDSYMRGRQYYYGFQIGAAYKITDNLSALSADGWCMPPRTTTVM